MPDTNNDKTPAENISSDWLSTYEKNRDDLIAAHAR